MKLPEPKSAPEWIHQHMHKVAPSKDPANLSEYDTGVRDLGRSLLHDLEGRAGDHVEVLLNARGDTMNSEGRKYKMSDPNYAGPKIGEFFLDFIGGSLVTGIYVLLSDPPKWAWVLFFLMVIIFFRMGRKNA